MPLRDKAVTKVRAEKTGTTGDKRTGHDGEEMKQEEEFKETSTLEPTPYALRIVSAVDAATP